MHRVTPAEFTPSYIELWKSGELSRRAEILRDALTSCTLCPRGCGADRTQSVAKGFCRTGRQAIVSSYFPHHGEERCLRGWAGSGTIFFSQCNLRCIFCQNYEISHLGEGRPVSAKELAEMMLTLQRRGCHNINFVTPSHVVAQIVEALEIAIPCGLHLPLVYNTGGYDSVPTLQLLEGIIDIYMPDIKFDDPEVARSLAHAPDYPQVVREAIREMHRQVGDLVINDQGLAQRGLLVRHLVMPNGLAGTRSLMRFLAQEISRDTFVNIMPQYRPEGKAYTHPQLGRPITWQEYRDAVAMARQEGLWRFDKE